MCSFIKSGEQGFEVVDAPDKVIDFFKADVFVCESKREGEFIAFEFEVAGTADTSDFEVSWIVGLWQLRRHLSPGIVIDRCRWDPADSLVRSFVIEVIDEDIEAMLLSLMIGFRRTCSLGLECAMEAFMTSILPRFARLDALMDNAEPNPPGAQLGQTQHSMRGEGYSVVGANRIRQSILVERDLEVTHGLLAADRLVRAHNEQITAALVRRGQGVAVSAVAKAELSFVVQAPDLIGSRRHQGHTFRFDRFASPPLRFDQVVPLEYITNRRASRQLKPGMFQAKTVDNHGSAPIRMGFAHLNNETLDLNRRFVRTASWCPTMISKPCFTLLAKTSEPLVASFTTDVKTGAQLAHRVNAGMISIDEPGAFIHGTGQVPRHGHSPLVNNNALN